MSGAILALDQSLARTGFALWRSGQDLITGSWPLAERASMRGLAYRELWGKLDTLHAESGFRLIIHERPAFGAANQGEAQLLAALGLIGVIELYATARGIEVQSYSVQSWRASWFLKHERKAIAAKPERVRDWKLPALMRARQLGFDPMSHDEAEAIGILDHHLLIAGILPSWRDPHPQLESVA